MSHLSDTNFADPGYNTTTTISATVPPQSFGLETSYAPYFPSITEDSLNLDYDFLTFNTSYEWDGTMVGHDWMWGSQTMATMAGGLYEPSENSRCHP